MQGEVVVKGKAASEGGCCKRGDVPVAQKLDSCDLLGQAKFAGPWGTVVRKLFRARKNGRKRAAKLTETGAKGPCGPKGSERILSPRDQEPEGKWPVGFLQFCGGAKSGREAATCRKNERTASAVHRKSWPCREGWRAVPPTLP